MKLKKILSAITVAISLLGFAQPSQALNISTDIVMIVDESGSMGDVQANLRNNIGLFASILSTGGVDARYALVGYGNSLVVPRLITDFTDAAGFAAAALGLQINGGTEPGFTASAFALNELDNQSSTLSYRTNAVKNLIIYTDEASNGDTVARGAVNGSAVSFAVIDGLLTDNNALYNAVVRAGAAGATGSFASLAANHGGLKFDLNGLNTTDQTVVQAFVTDFATKKLQETIDYCTANPNAPECQGSVPEPTSLALIGISIFGFGAFRRRQIS
jgi:hypothetical protein